MNQLNLLSEVKSRLGIADDRHDGLILSFINQVQEKIKSYCNINELPPGLGYLTVSMTTDLLRKEGFALMPDVAAIAAKDVKSVQRGDTTIQYEETKMDELLTVYEKELKRYRRIKAV